MHPACPCVLDGSGTRVHGPSEAPSRHLNEQVKVDWGVPPRLSCKGRSTPEHFMALKKLASFSIGCETAHSAAMKQRMTFSWSPWRTNAMKGFRFAISELTFPSGLDARAR